MDESSNSKLILRGDYTEQQNKEENHNEEDNANAGKIELLRDIIDKKKLHDVKPKDLKDNKKHNKEDGKENSGTKDDNSQDQ